MLNSTRGKNIWSKLFSTTRFSHWSMGWIGEGGSEGGTEGRGFEFYFFFSFVYLFLWNVTSHKGGRKPAHASDLVPAAGALPAPLRSNRETFFVHICVLYFKCWVLDNLPSLSCKGWQPYETLFPLLFNGPPLQLVEQKIFVTGVRGITLFPLFHSYPYGFSFLWFELFTAS